MGPEHWPAGAGVDVLGCMLMVGAGRLGDNPTHGLANTLDDAGTNHTESGFPHSVSQDSR